MARSTDGAGVLAKHADEAAAWLHGVKGRCIAGIPESWIWGCMGFKECRWFAWDQSGSGSDLDGIRIINKKYAGKTYELSGDLATKYPSGVKFSNEGKIC